jgi:putative tricarboxylic transport membrane protein
MIELLPILLLGVALGVFVGFLPGIGIFTTVMLLYPWLKELSGVELIAFYLALASTTQYIGSITATVFALPGESSSLPAVLEGHAMFRHGLGMQAISGAALGSFVGSTLVLVFTALLFSFVGQITVLYNSYVQSLILIIVLVIITTNSNNFVVSCMLAISGYLLASVGCDATTKACFATFDNTDLVSGLPIISVVSALYVVPSILRHQNIKFQVNVNQFNDVVSPLEHLRHYITNIGSSIRGTILGFVGGFVPGVGTTVASTVAYAYEKQRETAKGNYKEGNYRCLISAETANNAGAFSCLLPLLILGIPIVPSEALIYEIAVSNGFSYGGAQFTADFFLTIAYSLVFVNLLALIISWPLARQICRLQNINFRWLIVFILGVLVAVVIYSGQETWQSLYYFVVFMILLPIGIMLRNYNTLPLIFCFLIQSRIESVIPRTYQLITHAFI